MGGPALEDAADAAALLVYYKTRDTIADSGFWKRLGARCLLPFVSAGRKKAARAKPGAGRGHGGLYAAAGRAGTGEIPFR